jgi:hypothetical protein
MPPTLITTASWARAPLPLHPGDYLAVDAILFSITRLVVAWKVGQRPNLTVSLICIDKTGLLNLEFAYLTVPCTH